MKKLSVFLYAMVLVFGVVGTANSALIDRGGGLIYDEDQDITWLQNANYGAGSTYDDGDYPTDGKMSWHNAVAWADNLEYYDSVRNVILRDWRLPTTVDGLFVVGYDGTTTGGYNITTSEMGYMYYVNLGNLGGYATDGTEQPGRGTYNAGPFDSMWSNPYYWSGTEWSASNPVDMVWGFRFVFGYQRVIQKGSHHYAWAVMDGDVGPIPDPIPAYSCLGFEPPCDSTDVTLTVKKNKCIPLKTELTDEDGFPVTDTEIEYPPVLTLTSFSGAAVPFDVVIIEGLPPSEGTDGNQFEFIDGRWCFNLKVKDHYSAPGTYSFKMMTGNEDEYIIEPSCIVTILVEK